MQKKKRLRYYEGVIEGIYIFFTSALMESTTPKVHVRIFTFQLPVAEDFQHLDAAQLKVN